MSITDVMLNLDLKYMSIVWGFLGSAALIGNVLQVRTDKIVKEAGTYAMLDATNVIKRHLETRYNTAGAGVLLMLSYSSNMISTGFFLNPKTDDTVAISGWTALITGFVIKWLFERYAKYKIDKTMNIIKGEGSSKESSIMS